MADLTFDRTTARLELALSIEPLIAGIDLSQHSDSEDAPEAAEYDRLVELSPEALSDAFEDAWPGIADGFDIAADDGLTLAPIKSAIAIPVRDDQEGARISTLLLDFEVPKGAEAMSIAWQATYGPLILRYNAPDGSEYNAFLNNGDRSTAITIPKSGFFSRLFGN